jgi:Ribbon-helix-helix protein, copG family
VSSAKFAAITASLLARKGDASPSVVGPATAAPRPALVPRDERPFRSEPRQPDNAEKPRRIMVSMTQEELERLDIAAIKKGTSRHDIVRSALSDYFRKLSAEFPRPCPCMESGSCCPGTAPRNDGGSPFVSCACRRPRFRDIGDAGRREQVMT